MYILNIYNCSVLAACSEFPRRVFQAIFSRMSTYVQRLVWCCDCWWSLSLYSILIYVSCSWSLVTICYEAFKPWSCNLRWHSATRKPTDYLIQRYDIFICMSWYGPAFPLHSSFDILISMTLLATSRNSSLDLSRFSLPPRGASSIHLTTASHSTFERDCWKGLPGYCQVISEDRTSHKRTGNASSWSSCQENIRTEIFRVTVAIKKMLRVLASESAEESSSEWPGQMASSWEFFVPSVRRAKIWRNYESSLHKAGSKPSTQPDRCFLWSCFSFKSSWLCLAHPTPREIQVKIIENHTACSTVPIATINLKFDWISI